jgi:cation diffusion facilitator family transporter
MPGSASRLARYAWLSVATAIVTMALKLVAWRLTGSVGLLSDALESSVNLVAAVMALAMVSIAARPPDEEHAFGYGKAEYFASGVEGALILLAAAGIAWAAIGRLVDPRPLAHAGAGVAFTVVASLANLAVARVLLRAGRRHHSIAIEADGHHLMADVWTSVAVVAGILAVGATGWLRLDPAVALAVAVHVVWSGGRLVRRSWLGLLDAALPPSELAEVRAALERHGSSEVRFHAVRTRQAGARRFVSMHVLVPGAWTVRQGHALLERIEEDVRARIPNATVLTHLEALEDPASFEDEELDRAVSDAPGAGRARER